MSIRHVSAASAMSAYDLVAVGGLYMTRKECATRVIPRYDLPEASRPEREGAFLLVFLKIRWMDLWVGDFQEQSPVISVTSRRSIMLKIVLLAVCCAFYAVALDPAGPSLIISFGVDPGDTTYSPQTFTLPIPDAGEQTSIINTQGHTWNYFRIVQWPAQAAGASFAFYNGGNYVGEMDVHELDTGDSWQYGREYTLGQFNGGTLHGAPVDAGGYQTPEEEVMTVEDQRNQDAQAQVYRAYYRAGNWQETRPVISSLTFRLKPCRRHTWACI